MFEFNSTSTKMWPRFPRAGSLWELRPTDGPNNTKNPCPNAISGAWWYLCKINKIAEWVQWFKIQISQLWFGATLWLKLNYWRDDFGSCRQARTSRAVTEVILERPRLLKSLFCEPNPDKTVPEESRDVQSQHPFPLFSKWDCLLPIYSPDHLILFSLLIEKWRHRVSHPPTHYVSIQPGVIMGLCCALVSKQRAVSPHLSISKTKKS